MTSNGVESRWLPPATKVPAKPHTTTYSGVPIWITFLFDLSKVEGGGREGEVSPKNK